MVEVSLAVDKDDVGRGAPVGGRRVKEPPLNAVGVLDRTDLTDGANDLGLLPITEGLEPVCVTRGVTLVISVFGMGDALGVISLIRVD